jgi:energy-coupling factor transporter ATP-binding protein EcfA2
VTFDDGHGSDRAGSVGYVPQEDIVPLELPLRRTLRYAAAVRLPPSCTKASIDDLVDDTMDALGLADHGHVPVGSLSGGQRKRASIACELLTQPAVFFLDEPTSGLDPSAAAGIVDRLHELAAGGSTVVFTTHSVSDVERSDQVVVLASGGRLAFVGAPAEMLGHFKAATVSDVYDELLDLDGEIARLPRPVPTASTGEVPPRVRRPQAASWGRQWAVLTRRSAETIVRNRLTLAILLGSPAAVIAMFAVLFRPDAFEPSSADATAAVMATYWLAFAGFFFGLTFGLLQVCVEVPILRREHRAGVHIGAYLLSKVALLFPFLLAVNATMLVVLRLLDRLPSVSAGAYGSLLVTTSLNALVALCLGLLASALVTTTAQAALALPMLCFPAVLFAGAMIPVPLMAPAGRSIAAIMPDRWAFEAIARDLDISALSAPGSAHAALGASATTTYWALLIIFTVVLGALAQSAVRRRAAG